MAAREAVNFTGSGKPVIHGQASTYNNHKCGCKECKAAWAKYVKDRGYVAKFREKERKAKLAAKTGTKINL